jgi:hypothetical protein
MSIAKLLVSERTVSTNSTILQVFDISPGHVCSVRDDPFTRSIRAGILGSSCCAWAALIAAARAAAKGRRAEAERKAYWPALVSR